jgi:1,4-alpha-glucan branching enzyme
MDGMIGMPAGGVKLHAMCILESTTAAACGARQEVPMLRKQNAAGGKVKVTFSLPALEGVATLYLTGSFNDWSDPGLPMVHGADGGWSAALTLDAGWAYQYRFRDQDGGWHNTGPRIPTCPTSSAARTRY